jgi:hypothetical protein
MFEARAQRLQRRTDWTAEHLDPAALSEDEAIVSLECLVKIVNQAEAMKAVVALRLADFDVWRTEGDRSPAHLLARKAGMGVGAAKDALTTAERAKNLPGVESALRKGELSPGQANAITDAATADPGSEERLLDCAKRKSLSELRDECARTKAAADPDPEETHRRIHAQRRARMRDCPDGAGEITYRSTKDEIAEFWKMVQYFGDKAFRAARSEGRVEGHDAYLADGMLGMARAAAGGTSKKRVPTKVIVRIDWDALVRGYPIEGETCEVSGIGPVPVGIVRNMIERGDVFLASVVTKGQDVVNVVHYSRKARSMQYTALEWLDPACTVEGCNHTDGLEVDHREDWADTKITWLSLLDRLCKYHHMMKTRYNWALVAGRGKRKMVPPGHPEHPGTKSGAKSRQNLRRTA